MTTLMRLQITALKMIASGEAFDRIATYLCLELERLIPKAICSIFIVNDLEISDVLAIPGLPERHAAAMEGIQAEVTACSSGSAIHPDKSRRACWLFPIMNDTDVPFAKLAISFEKGRCPTDTELMIIDQCIPIITIAIESWNRIAEYQRQARTDLLTGVLNRTAFDKILTSLLEDKEDALAVFIINIDNLNIVNKSIGYWTGDCLLKNVGKRISETIHPDRIFRVGSNEFAVILTSTHALHDLKVTAERIVNDLDKPINCGGYNIIPRVTIGGAERQVSGCTAKDVHQNAYFALCHAKETDRGGFVQYWPGLGVDKIHQFNTLRNVEEALQEGRINAYYQPIVSLDTREIIGLEALCRMKIGSQVVPAADFHSATTDAHIGVTLTARMISLVAADVRSWLDRGIPFQHVGINVSSADMHYDVVQVLEAAFVANGVSLRHAILEVTESVYMGHSDGIVQKAIEAVRAKGIRVALDDFGTGFASLTHLLTVPVDVIKIDKTFVDRLMPGDPSAAIIEGLINIAQNLNIRVVAEGIETEEQARHLQALGCKLGQGYLFGRAMDAQSTMTVLLRNAQKNPS